MSRYTRRYFTRDRFGTARDQYGVERHLKYAYICQDCRHRWGAERHQPDPQCPRCGHFHSRRYRPVADLTRRQRRALMGVA